jgi:replication-associated recombination protein RarA
MPLNLSEKYRPEKLLGFAGLDRPKALLSALAAEPYPSAWLLVGPSGLGKTTAVMAVSKQINGMMHHIPSRHCDLETVDKTIRSCHYRPMHPFDWNVVLVDEADKMTNPAQLAFLSALDSTAMPEGTIFFFTANSVRSLEMRFRSRCRLVMFTTEGIHEPGMKLLARIWRKESKAPAPDFALILKAAAYNIRTALMLLETEMIAPSTPEELAMQAEANTSPAEKTTPIDTEGLNPAQKAWVTRRRLAAEKGAA